jgi:hypothetical protein
MIRFIQEMIAMNFFWIVVYEFVKACLQEGNKCGTYVENGTLACCSGTYCYEDTYCISN